MIEVAVLFLLAAAFLVANNKYEETGQWRYRRMRSAFVWAFIGAIVGSSIGIAGLGTAIAGTTPGAIVGYLLASNIMKKDANPNE